ncbi:NADH-quinone oxidoreductase subunit NuoH [Pseudoduganella sp. SL102]|uniref:NADH-quinone oxidoreductase subunit H n=1 Tax=Pseudoduganella albidiflava TaxID=321983 RepID=A0A411WVB8_9BURK|nr:MULTISPECIES: NADH-quinone oxidoreductase subunit NuoH [Pseudoduganella]QBI00578.1 NADH-quinone oxidoreductase subunit NuoH [Pseudoduganella albidiflava]WBS01363.1 NADH-quinone oxidoreductase subunit NuoH [Pseudoduganella sp. SL102]GGY32215.1 NADH-quinone oxidoreductase subunit H [Pseudoduganella albidiflava]
MALEFVNTINTAGADALGSAWPFVWTMIKLLCVLMPLLGMVAYATLWERKLIGFIQIRIGPNRVGPMGLLQPMADGIKMLLKEIVVPTKAAKSLFVIGPVMTIMPALAAWSVVPFGPEAVLANVNAGLLVLLAITSMEVYGIIIAGWSSNSKYSFMGAMRASAQMISYEIPMGFALVVILMVSGSLNFIDIVVSQQTGRFADMGVNFMSWNWLPLLPLFVVYLTSGLAEANRAPFDVVEGESEIVAGHMVEYSGMSYAMFMLAEYANIILVGALASIMFLGGWSAPFAFLEFGGGFGGFFWLFVKTFLIVSLFIWVRGTFPRYRYDQIMRLGWKVFIPLTLFWLVLVATWMQTPWNIWK